MTLRDMRLVKPYVRGSKTILTSWTSFSSLRGQISTLVITCTKRTCDLGLRLKHISISIAHLVCRKWMFSVCNGIHGPYLSKNAHGRPVNLNTEWQIELIGRKFIPALRRKRGVDMDTVIYQQVEANSLSAVDGDKLVILFFLSPKKDFGIVPLL